MQSPTCLVGGLLTRRQTQVAMDSPFVGGSMEYSKKQELVNYHIGLAWDGMKG